MNNVVVDDPTGQYVSLFKTFVGREAHLETIVRYENYQTYFPTNLNHHQHQVAALTRHIMWMISPDENGFDLTKAVIMAYIHDDHEPFMEAGDFQSADRVHMNVMQKKTLQEDEQRAILMAIDTYPERIGEYAYADLLWDAASRNATLEAQLVKWADKLAGLGESLHEIHAGNTIMSTGVMSQRFNVLNVSPIEYYREYFAHIKEKLPVLADAFNFDAYWFAQPYSKDRLPWDFYNLWVYALKAYAPPWEQERLLL